MSRLKTGRCNISVHEDEGQGSKRDVCDRRVHKDNCQASKLGCCDRSVHEDKGQGPKWDVATEVSTRTTVKHKTGMFRQCVLKDKCAGSKWDAVKTRGCDELGLKAVLCDNATRPTLSSNTIYLAPHPHPW